MSNIAYLGAGTWGSALATLLSGNGHKVTVWDRNKDLIDRLNETRKHPKLPGFTLPKNICFVKEIKTAVQDANLIVESVTSSGIRPVFSEVLFHRKELCPIVITSKGIEQNTCLLFPEIAEEIFGEKNRHFIGCLSGPSHAEEVINNLPTSIVGAAFDEKVMMQIVEAFNSPTFRVYPNSDVMGVCFGGAMKNIIAIACGISDGLHFGDNTKAALMTRGLHEIRKLSAIKGARAETLNGLSGLGDLFVTCSSTLSRNYRFGRLIAEGYSVEKAKEEIGMVVEGAYTCVSALDLANKHGIPVPITEATYGVLFENLAPKKAVKALLQRSIKEEHL